MGPLGELWRLGSREGMWQSPKRQMSDSLGAAPLAQFAPTSLTSTPPEADAGVEAAEMVLGGSQQPGKKRRRKGRTRITRKQIAAKRARSEGHEAPGS